LAGFRHERYLRFLRGWNAALRRARRLARVCARIDLPGLRIGGLFLGNGNSRKRHCDGGSNYGRQA
jgi:hypothetical protein